MNRTIVFTLLAFCLIGLTSAGFTLLWAKVPETIRVRDQDTDSLVNTQALLALHDYDLLIPDSILPQDGDTLTWHIQKKEITGLVPQSFQLNEPVREWNFKDTGYYDVRAFKGMKEVGASLLHVIDGDHFEVQWGTPLEQELGTPFSFRDVSTNVKKRAWTISRASSGETVASDEDVIFDWTPADTGTYVARVKVEFRSGKEDESTETLRVVVPAPEPVVAEVKPPPVAKPKKEVKPWVPPVRVPPPPSSSAHCFVTERVEGTTFIVPIDKPTREQVEFLDESTSFTISPRYNCMFTGFDYFSNAQIDDIEITIECLQEFCTGKSRYPMRQKGGYDAHDAAHIQFTTPILNKDFRYRVTVKAKSPGKLGFYTTKGNSFREEKNGQAIRNGNGSLTIHGTKTCIFNLKFVR